MAAGEINAESNESNGQVKIFKRRSRPLLERQIEWWRDQKRLNKLLSRKGKKSRDRKEASSKRNKKRKSRRIQWWRAKQPQELAWARRRKDNAIRQAKKNIASVKKLNFAEEKDGFLTNPKHTPK